MCSHISPEQSQELREGPLPQSLLDQVPNHPACTEALTTAQALLPASVFNHSFRTYIYAHHASQLPSSISSPYFTTPPVDPHVLFVSCILHDIGAATAHAPTPVRFEVTGADVTAALLQRHADVDTATVREAWLAVALHSSPHIAEAAGGLVRTLRMGVRADFGILDLQDTQLLDEDGVRELERLLPRLEVEKELGDVVVQQARMTRSKAPGGSWPGDLLRAAEADPEWNGVNKAF